MPAKYVRPYSKGQKNDFNDAEAIAEAVQRPTMKFVATKTAEQLDLQALHRRARAAVSQRHRHHQPDSRLHAGTRDRRAQGIASCARNCPPSLRRAPMPCRHGMLRVIEELAGDCAAGSAHRWPIRRDFEALASGSGIFAP